MQASTLLKKRLLHRCFPVNFVKFLITSILTEHLWWLLIYVWWAWWWCHWGWYDWIEYVWLKNLFPFFHFKIIFRSTCSKPSPATITRTTIAGTFMWILWNVFSIKHLSKATSLNTKKNNKQTTIGKDSSSTRYVDWI